MNARELSQWSLTAAWLIATCTGITVAVLTFPPCHPRRVKVAIPNEDLVLLREMNATLRGIITHIGSIEAKLNHPAVAPIQPLQWSVPQPYPYMPQFVPGIYPNQYNLTNSVITNTLVLPQTLQFGPINIGTNKLPESLLHPNLLLKP